MFASNGKSLIVPNSEMKHKKLLQRQANLSQRNELISTTCDGRIEGPL